MPQETCHEPPTRPSNHDDDGNKDDNDDDDDNEEEQDECKGEDEDLYAATASPIQCVRVSMYRQPLPSRHSSCDLCVFGSQPCTLPRVASPLPSRHSSCDLCVFGSQPCTPPTFHPLPRDLLAPSSVDRESVQHASGLGRAKRQGECLISAHGCASLFNNGYIKPGRSCTSFSELFACVCTSIHNPAHMSPHTQTRAPA